MKVINVKYFQLQIYYKSIGNIIPSLSEYVENKTYFEINIIKNKTMDCKILQNSHNVRLYLMKKYCIL